MALNLTQIAAVMQVLNASSLDPQIIIEVQAMLNPQGQVTTVTTETTYAKIKEYCNAYCESLETLDTGVAQPDYEKEMMLVYMDKDKVSNLLSLVPTDGYVAGIMGIYDNALSKKQLTISLLPTDSTFKFVQDAAGAIVNGEQCWKQIDTVQNFSTVFS